MKRLKGMWKETWWVWAIFFVFGCVMSYFVHLSFLTVFPISIFSFIYFMFMRYDENGNNKGDMH